MSKQEYIKREIIVGSRRLSNYWWATFILLGGISFFLTGLSSYVKIKIFFFMNNENILFIPQGLVMIFYGTLATLIGIFLWLTIFWDIGSGYNEFNKELKKITIFRQGFPGPNHKLFFYYSMSEIKSIKLVIKEGLNPKRIILLKIKDNREIPLIQVGNLLSLEEIETKAIQLAQFLEVTLE